MRLNPNYENSISQVEFDIKFFFFYLWRSKDITIKTLIVGGIPLPIFPRINFNSQIFQSSNYKKRYQSF